MLTIERVFTNMTDTVVANQTPPEEILEDGEIDDEEEVVTEETEVVEEAGTETGSHNSHQNEQSSEYYAKYSRTGSLINEQNDNDDDESADEDRKKPHKKHQRKRKKHRDSKERELRAEKKERRRKRKMHAHEDVADHQEHGGSLSPHSKRRRKKKKHSKDRRDSTTPDSDESIEQYPQAYYGTNNGYVEGYGVDNSMYHSSKSAYGVGNNPYYSPSVDQGYDQNESKEYGNDSASDFEAQLAEYKNYKTHGDSFTNDQNHEDKSSKPSSSGNGGEMYEEFMEYDENPKRLCKFFAEGKCLKGNECSFSHDQSTRRGKAKKREMCKYYLAGHCHHGNQCTYMHGEYPCKYFHTGVTCYAGDNCRFSHDPPTAETKEIIDNFKDILGNVDDSWEVSELTKLGIKIHPKPPPGVGLLPTPDIPPMSEKDQSSNVTGGLAKPVKAIPSIFDISVAPSAELQKRIDENNVASLAMNDESGGMNNSGMKQLPPQLFNNPIGRKTINNGGGLLPTPTTMPMHPNIYQQDSNHHEEDDPYGGYYEEPDMDDGEKHFDSEDKAAKSEDDVIKTEDEFIRMDHSTAEEEEIKEEPVKVPDFLPATQKALFMRIHGKRVPADKDSDKKNSKRKDSWTYSSDEDEKQSIVDPGIIKMEVDSPTSSSDIASTTSSAVQSLIKMISKAGNPAHLDTNLLSKVASVINIPSTATEHYNPAASIATYNPAQAKATPRHVAANPQPRERRTSGSMSASPGHSTKHRRTSPIRRRLSTQELTKEPVVIPLVSKQSGNQSMHTAHPDPRITLSRLMGMKSSRFSANLPRFSKDLILPGSNQMLGLKVTLSSEDSKPAKRDPRLGRQKDPRLQRSNDPRLKSRGMLKSSTSSSTTVMTTEAKSSVPLKPPALLSKSSTTIPSLPELDLNLAYIKQVSKENGDSDGNHKPQTTSAPSYSLPALKLPRLVKAPSVTSPPKDSKPASSPTSEPSVPPVALYDPRFISYGAGNSSSSSDLPISTALYDPRALTGQSSGNTGGEIKKRTIQLPKLTPAPSYKPIDASADPDRPEGDQADF